MQPRLLTLLVIFCCLSLIILPASAQTGRIVRLSSPDTSQFPTVQVFMDVHDSSGSFIHNLLPEQVSVIESGKNVSIIEMEEIRPGVQFVVAFNPGPPFAIRNAQGVSRFELIQEALRKWAISRLGTTTDDWSLLVGPKAGISHTADPAEFLDSLVNTDGEQRDTRASIDVLASAVRLASDPVPRPGMGKAVLFITSAIDGDIEQAVRDISDQANAQEISISIWLVESRGAAMTQSTQQLLSLAANNGGQVFTFSGEETIPNPDEYLNAIRYLYRLTYKSQSGLDSDQKFWAEVKFNDEVVQSNQLSFRVDLLPPLPAFIAPPISIERTSVSQAENPAEQESLDGQQNAGDLLPAEVELKVIFDFPDGRKRDLARSALLVDGMVVEEKLAPPFDQFKWDLRGYLSDATALIQVECTDTLGLTGRSIVIPVRISVKRPAQDPLYLLRNHFAAVVLLFLVLAVGLSFWALVLAGKLHPFAQFPANRASIKKQPINNAKPPAKTPADLFKPKSHLQEISFPVPANVNLYLQRIDDQFKSLYGTIIPIVQENILVGSDPSQSDLVLKESDIDPVHAKLEIHKDGECWLFDIGSIGGTWVNFTSIAENGTKLSSGDLIHFGRIGFLFVRKATSASQPPDIRNETPQKTKGLPDAAAGQEKETQQ